MFLRIKSIKNPLMLALITKITKMHGGEVITRKGASTIVFRHITPQGTTVTTSYKNKVLLKEIKSETLSAEKMVKSVLNIGNITHEPESDILLRNIQVENFKTGKTSKISEIISLDRMKDGLDKKPKKNSHHTCKKNYDENGKTESFLLSFVNKGKLDYQKISSGNSSDFSDYDMQMFDEFRKNALLQAFRIKSSLNKALSYVKNELNNSYINKIINFYNKR